MTSDEIARIKELTNLMSLKIITQNEILELDTLQEKWLLHSDIKSDYRVKARFS